MARVNKAKPRRRRDAESAREAILDAAEKQLVVNGPSGIRLQEVATEAGVSHPTVLHHFGSRELLVKAVCTRSLQAIHAGLVEAIDSQGESAGVLPARRPIAGSTGGDDQLAALLDGVYDALTKSGHARVMMWLALEGQRLDGADVRLDQVVSATHELRKKRVRATGSRRAIPVEDTAHAVVLAALALVGSAVIGPPIFENAGLGGDAAAGVRFRSWLAKLLTRHLEGVD